MSKLFTGTSKKATLNWQLTYKKLIQFSCSSLFLLAQHFDVSAQEQKLPVSSGTRIGIDAYDAEKYETAFKNLIADTAANYTSGQYYLGLCYYYGKGTAIDFQKAYQYFLKAGKKKDPLAQNFLGVMRQFGQGVSIDVTDAVNWYKLSADSGYSYGQYNLGWMYRNGVGVQKNDSLATKLFVDAAAKSQPSAMAELGYIYLNGYGVTQDYEKALTWTSKAAELNSETAQYNMGWMYYQGNGVVKNEKTALSWFYKAALNGSDDAEAMLGAWYQDGNILPKNDSLAIVWYMKAAAKDNLRAINNLGTMYEEGSGVKQDYKEAAKWYQVAVDKDHSYSELNLGRLYLHGNGVPENDSMAFVLFTKAAVQNNTGAQYQLGRMYEFAMGTEKSDSLAKIWYAKSAEKENVDAKIRLFYMHGSKLLKAEKYDSAVVLYSNLIKLNENEIDAYYNRGLAYKNLNLTKEAIKDFKVYAKYSSDPFDGWYQQAFIEQKKNKFSGANKLLVKSLKYAQDSSRVYNEMAWNWYLAKNYKKALEYAHEAVNKNVKNDDAFDTRACILYKLGKIDEAIPDFTQALALNEKYSNSRYYRALCYLQKNEKTKACADLTVLIDSEYKIKEGELSVEELLKINCKGQ